MATVGQASSLSGSAQAEVDGLRKAAPPARR
jgi:hypothetical protein